MVKKKLIKEVTVYSAALYVAQFLLTIRGFLIAYLLGPSLYGIWSIIRTFLGFAEYTGLGASQGIMREIPYWRGQGKNDEAFAAQQDCLYWSLGVSVLITGAMLVYTVCCQPREQYFVMIVAGIVYISSAIIFHVKMVLYCNNNIYGVSLVSIMYGILNTVFGLLGVFYFGVLGLLLSLLLTNGIIACYLTIKKEVPWRFSFNLRSVQHLLKVGFPMMVLSLAFFAMCRLDNIIVFKMLGSTHAGYYGIAVFLALVISYIPASISTVLFPKMMINYGEQKDVKILRRYYKRPILFLAVFMPLILGFLYINIDIPIVLALVKYKPAIPTIKTLVIFLFFSAIMKIPINILIALNKQHVVMGMVLFVLLCGVVADVVLIHYGFGIIGVAYASGFVFLLIAACTNVFTLTRLYKKAKSMRLFTFHMLLPFMYMIGSLALAYIASEYMSNSFIMRKFLENCVYAVAAIPLVLQLHKRENLVKIVQKLFHSKINGV